MKKLEDIFKKIKRQVPKPRRLLQKIISKSLKQEYVNSKYGIKLKTNWGDPAFEVYFYGLFGNDLPKIIASQKSPFYFLDIGSNQGLYSILAAKNSYCIKAFAFEPVPETASFLRKNVSINQLDKKIEVNEMAVSDNESEMEISYDDPAKASLLEFRQRKKNQKLFFELKKCKIKVVNFEKLNSLNINKNKNIIVKIDVEGLEEKVINELLKTNFSENISEIIYEIVESEKWEKYVRPDNIKSTLENFGFKNFKKIAIFKSKNMLKYDVHAKR